MKRNAHDRALPGSVERQRGSATIEYALITSLAVLVLVANPNVVGEIINAIKQVYDAFTYALAITFPTPD